MENKLFIIISPELLRLHRTINKKKQHEMADLLGVERTTYVGYESKQELKLPSPQAEKVAKFLGVSISQLQNVEKVPPKDVDGIIPIHREVWHELRENNKTYKEFLNAYKNSFNALLKTVDSTMENLSKGANGNS